jgi:hypothetical protein
LPTDAALLFEEPLRKFSDRRHSLAILAVSQFARTEAVCLLCLGTSLGEEFSGVSLSDLNGWIAKVQIRPIPLTGS